MEAFVDRQARGSGVPRDDGALDWDGYRTKLDRTGFARPPNRRNQQQEKKRVRREHRKSLHVSEISKRKKGKRFHGDRRYTRTLAQMYAEKGDSDRLEQKVGTVKMVVRCVTEGQIRGRTKQCH